MATKSEALQHLVNIVPNKELADVIFQDYTSFYPEAEAYNKILNIKPFDVDSYSKDLPKGSLVAGRGDYSLSVPGYEYPYIRDDTLGFQFPMRNAPNLFIVDPDYRQRENVQRTLLHETEHTLLDKASEDLSSKQNAQELAFRQAGGDASKFYKAFNNIMPYLQDKYNFEPQGSLAENLTELAAVEQFTGNDITNDPYLRKNLFKNHGDRIAYRATSGLRKTRLDAKDLQPLEPVPEANTSMMDRIIQYFTPNDYSFDDLYTNPLMKDPFE